MNGPAFHAPTPADEAAQATAYAARRKAWKAGRLIVTAGPDVADDFEPGTDPADALAELVAAHGLPAELGGHESADLVLWRDGTALALVRAGTGGRSRVIRLEPREPNG